MRLDYEKKGGLSRLAWCASVVEGADFAHVLHGQDVETNPSFFFEGVWAGDFESGRFPEAIASFGSGARDCDTGFLVSTPTHTLDRVYFLKLDKRVLISNSLAFVLSQAHDELDPHHPHYVRDWLTLLLDGIGRKEQVFPTRRGHLVHLIHYANIHIAGDLSVTIHQKRLPPTFESFDAYDQFLQTTLEELQGNANDPARTHTYRPIATTSSGYDSPAATVLARRIGCRQALTFTKARKDLSWEDGSDDSGAPIARSLGLEVIEFDRERYLAMGNGHEAEFLACGSLDDVILAAMEEELPGALLFTGIHGDVAWTLEKDKFSPNLCRKELGGVTLGEFRLRVGFAQIPVPFVGAAGNTSLYNIGISPEMRPWSIGGKYDRPIPRRLVEDAGIAREAFGRRKLAAAVQQYHNYHDLQATLSPQAYEAYQAYVRSLPWQVRATASIMRRVLNSRDRALNAVLTVRSWLIRNCNGKPIVWRLADALKERRLLPHQPYPEYLRDTYPPGNLLFLWGLSEVMRRYHKAMAPDPKEQPIGQPSQRTSNLINPADPTTPHPNELQVKSESSPDP